MVQKTINMIGNQAAAVIDEKHGLILELRASQGSLSVRAKVNEEDFLAFAERVRCHYHPPVTVPKAKAAVPKPTKATPRVAKKTPVRKAKAKSKAKK